MKGNMNIFRPNLYTVLNIAKEGGEGGKIGEERVRSHIKYVGRK